MTSINEFGFQLNLWAVCRGLLISCVPLAIIVPWSLTGTIGEWSDYLFLVALLFSVPAFFLLLGFQIAVEERCASFDTFRRKATRVGLLLAVISCAPFIASAVLAEARTEQVATTLQLLGYGVALVMVSVTYASVFWWFAIRPQQWALPESRS